MNTKFYWLILLLLFFLFSCTDRKVNHSINRLILHPEEVLDRELSEVMDIVAVLPLECTDSNLISSVSDMMIYQNRIYILDRNQHAVFIFDNKGKALHTIHSVGEGPNEYLGLSCFYIDKNKGNLILVDNRRKKRLVYDVSGMLKQVENIDFSVKCVDYLVDGTEIMVQDMVDGMNPKGSFVHVQCPNGDTIRFLPFEYESGSLIVEKNKPLLGVGEKCYYHSVSSDTVYEYREGVFQPKYMFDFSGKGIPEEIMQLPPCQFGEAYFNYLTEHPSVAYWPVLLDANENNLFLAYVYGKKMCYCHYDLNSASVMQFAGPFLEGVCMSDLVSGTYFLGGRLCFILDNFKLSQLSSVAIEKWSSSYPGLYNAVKENKLEDNPILLFANAKGVKI